MRTIRKLFQVTWGVALYLIFSFSYNVFSQTTVGPRNPTVVTDNGGGGGGVPSWNITGTPFSSNNSYSTITSQAKNKSTNYLHITGFGFAIPVGSYIVGIEVEVEMYGTVPVGASNVEQSILLINSSSTRAGTDHSTGATIPTTDPNAYVTYGGPNDKWGGGFTYNDINSVNFGVALQYTTGTVNNAAGNYNFNIDHVRITVTYAPAYDAVVNNGCFNDGATWGRVSPGTAGVDYPDATIVANIPGGKTVRVCSGTTANCFSLITNSNLSTSSAAVLTLVDATSTLNVANDIIMQTTTSSSANFASGTLNLNGGTINIAGGLIMTADKNGGNKTTNSVVFGGGTLTVDGNVLMSSDHSSATNTLDMTSANSVFNLAGSLTLGTGGSLTNGSGATGTVNYKGSGAQTIYSNITYYNLTTSGGGLKTLDGNTTVKGTLNMLSGNTDLDANTITLGASTAAIGTLSRTSGTLYNGTFTRYFNTSTIADGAVEGLFPVGTSTDYRPFNVFFPTTGPSSGGTLSMIHTDPGGFVPVSFADGASTVAVRTNANWLLTAANSFNSAANNLNISIQGTSLGTIGNVDDLRVTLAASAIGSSGTNSNPTNNPKVKRTSLPTFNASNRFYLGSVNTTTSPLPIELLYFSARSDDKKIVLNWVTASEINNDYFTIEKTLDGVNFEVVSIVKGAGNTSSVLNYSSEDNYPHEGVSYYRLKQTDFDGNYSYSDIRMVNFLTDDDFHFNIYPNPNNGETFSLQLTSNINEEILVVVYDIVGNEMYSKIIITSSNGGDVHAVDPSQKLNPGVYLVTATSNDKIYNKRLIVN